MGCSVGRTRLSEVLGAEVFRTSGIGHHDDTGQLRTRITGLEQTILDLRQQLQERADDLDAARSANRDLMAQLNHAIRRAQPKFPG